MPEEAANQPDEAVSESDETIQLSFYSAFKREQSAAEHSYTLYAASGSYALDLQTAWSDFGSADDFVAGQLIQWKPFLKNMAFPKLGNPAIVVEVLTEPLTVDSEGKRLLVPHDLLVGFLDGTQEMNLFTSSSRRWTLWDKA